MVMRIVLLLLVASAFRQAEAFQSTRIFRPERLGCGNTNITPQQPIDEASWIWSQEDRRNGAADFVVMNPTPVQFAAEPTEFLRFRKVFPAVPGEDLELDVSADERYVLFLDGKEISRGPHRGLPTHWHYQSYRIAGLEHGEHVLEAVVCRLGLHAPLAQTSVRGGFILKASGSYDAQLTTGRAAWTSASLQGTRMTDRGDSGTLGVGSQCEVTGASCLHERPADSDYRPTRVVRGKVWTACGLPMPGWRLFPTALPDMMVERKAPGRIVQGPNVLVPGTTIPPRGKVRILWDLGNYYCAYPLLSVSGGRGTTVRWGWTECLRTSEGKKDDRAAWKGLEFRQGFSDVFRPDGRTAAVFTTPWWRCGRWCVLDVVTGDEPLSVESVAIVETRYPAQPVARFACDDETVSAIQPICARALEMCMHETSVDCPFYEQQMYPGDGRLHFLGAGLFGNGERLIRQSLTLFDEDRRPSGLFPFNTPTRGVQDGIGFSLCVAAAFGDYLMNHDDRNWLLSRLPGLNHSLLGCEAYCRRDGLLVSTPGWNFVDWVPRWRRGIPPAGDGPEPNAELNLQYLHAVLAAESCNRALGDEILAERWHRRAELLRMSIRAAFWSPDRSLFASTPAQRDFSEQAQALALLGDVVTGETAEACFRALVSAEGLDRGSIYFKHYLFQAYFKFGRADLFLSDLGFWTDCLQRHFATVPETPDLQARSDCHGWGVHPLVHLHAGVAGVRSEAPFYAKAIVAPQPGNLRFIRSETPTPKGPVALDLRFDGGVRGSVTVPTGLPTAFRWKGKDISLSAGTNVIEIRE